MDRSERRRLRKQRQRYKRVKPKVITMDMKQRMKIENDLSEGISLVMNADWMELRKMESFARRIHEAGELGAFSAVHPQHGMVIVELPEEWQKLFKSQAADVLEAIRKRREELGVS